MVKNIKKDFIKFILKNKLISENDKIVVGLSGGPDSICLLSLLNGIKEDFNITIVAAHINHMFRGEEAEKDEEYAKGICENNNIPFYSTKVNVSQYGKERGLSSESAGREVRYKFFSEILQKNNMNKIATAHNANDQAETILMRIMRGTGLEGLCGIPVKRDNTYIRPILFMSREEVEEYCMEKDLNPRIDKTNLERIYNRNKVRLDILPYMKSNFNKDIVETINRMGSIVQDDNEFIEHESKKYYNIFCVKNKSEISIKPDAFKLHSAIINRVIRKAVNEVSGNKYDLEYKHITDIIELQSSKTGKKIDLPNKIEACNIYKQVLIRHKEENVESKDSNNNIVFKIKEFLHKKVEFSDYTFNFEVIKISEKINITNNDVIKYFDYNKIVDSVIIRNRKDGDKIQLLGMKGNKKLKDLFIDMKIPKQERELIPIIQFDNDISWIVGIRTSEKFKVTSKTVEVLKITAKRKEK